ncbi:MAG: hypothetical protein IKQ07_05115 [Bacteroidaceae bacterium]|nr:hypothetical protein [Bacteroidaceae bacterium]
MGAMIYAGHEIPESISQTVYLMPRKCQWVFTIVMMSVGFLLVPVLMEISTERTQVFAFLMTGGILGVGASPLVAKERNIFHYVCAAVSGIASQVLVALNQPLCLLAWFLYVGYTLFAKDVSRHFFWAEVMCMLTTFVYCFV